MNNPFPPQTPPRLTDGERAVLRMLDGEADLPWGAWVGACLEHLEGAGYVTAMPYCITDAGRRALAQEVPDR